MANTLLAPERFPLIYEAGQPIAVVVDLATFQALVAAAEHLEQLEAADAAWMPALIERVRAYRQQHPDQVLTFATPEAALAALDAPDA